MFEKYIRSNGNDGVIHKLFKGEFRPDSFKHVVYLSFSVLFNK
jgi:hypothetical protein